MHGLMFGGWVDSSVGGIFAGRSHVSSKRAAGAHTIASHLRREGWDIEVIDFFPAWTIEELKELMGLRVRKDTKFIGISVSIPPETVSIYHGAEFVRWVKKTYPDIVVLAGSQHLMTTHHLPADYHLAGYGERSLTELLKHIEGKPSNVVIEKVTLTPDIIDDVEKTLNFVNCDTSNPAYPMEDPATIYEARDFIEPHEVLSIEVNRGCKFKCKFCSFNLIGMRQDTSRCYHGLHDELKRNYESWGVTDYTNVDETSNANPSSMEGSAEVIRKLGFEINMQGFIRADLLAARPQDWEHIADMGLWGHFYGIESFNYESAKSVGKGMRPEKVKEGLLAAQEYFKKRCKYYRATSSFIIGLPHETEETFDDGIKWIFDNMEAPNAVLFPLFIQHELVGSKLKNKYSELDYTFKDSPLIQEATLQDLRPNYDDIGNDIMWQHMLQTGSTLWKHDTMNIYEAWKIMAKYANDPAFHQNQRPSIWHFHRFKQAGLQMKDMMRPISDFEDINYCIDADEDFTKKYILKKLCL